MAERPSFATVRDLHRSPNGSQCEPPSVAVAVTDTSVTKVKASFSPHGPDGQRYLALGVHVAKRRWEKPGKSKPATRREYETVGYVLSGRAGLHIERQVVLLEPGDSWAVPRGAELSYKVLATFSAVEATARPAHAKGCDE
jgi:mannose-6-phosphate isomerase-like protein (cupin superfamily)